MRHSSLLLMLALLLPAITCFAQSPAKVLFDATKAETAGNADWVIDANMHNLNYNPGASTSGGNESNAQRIPTPAQSGITSSTTETYWQGALSAWGVDCAKQGLTVETLPWNGSITYGNTANAQDLSNYKVYIICEPNIQFTNAEKTAILHFVQAGGGLFMISDHNQSDRNGDGWDSPAIWNDLLNSNAVQAHPFGLSFDLQDFSGTSTNVIASANDSIIHGALGTVAEVQWSNGTSMTLTPSQNASVKGVVYKTGASAGNTNVMAAYGRFGSGKFCAIGDSSPCDDGTGDPNDQLYNGYTGDAAGNHRKLLMNATLWLAALGSSGTGITGAEQVPHIFTVSPNPCRASIRLLSNALLNDAIVNVYDMMGRCVYSRTERYLSAGKSLIIPNVGEGIYILSVQSGATIQREKVLVD